MSQTLGNIAGVDEAGRGPLAGPVVAAAVILPVRHGIRGLADSKQLTAVQRDHLFDKITANCIAYGVGKAEVEEIERLNIHYATLLAMQRAVEALNIQPDMVWVDGLFCPTVIMPTKAIVHGDETVPVISAASIIAKVSRDREMIQYDQVYPGYGFGQHKGYSTEQHQIALKKLGPCPIHRRNFTTVANSLNASLTELTEFP